MKHLATALAASVPLLLLAFAMPVGSQTAPSPTAPEPPMRFGMDAGSLAAQAGAGVPADYGTFWIGPWTLSSGWGGPDAQLVAMRDANVTPAIHFYYWGDDISPSCVENGCWSSLHNSWKDRAGWERLGTQLTDHLNAKMGGKPVVVFLESEFNKGGIEAYEPFDGYLAAMAGKIHAAYPAAVVVLGFGNWGSTHWGTFDRAAAASDMVGVQGMRGSTRQAEVDMYTLYDGLLSGVKSLESKFPGTPIMLTDIAVSSYPEPGYVGVQADALREVLDNLGTLRAHGVEAMVYRSWKDSPTMDTANYYGQAERHWGLAWAANGTQKASGQLWVEAVQAERARAAPAVNAPPTAAFAASASGLAVAVDAAASADPDGDTLAYAWSFGDGAGATGRTASHAYASGGSYTVALTVSDGQAAAQSTRTVTVAKPYAADITVGPGANEWWVEAKVRSDPAPAKVEVKAGSGSWTPLRQRDSGTWGEALHVVKGTTVSFRATAPDGQAATTAGQPWLGTAATSSSTTTTSSTAFKATFTPKAVGNDWWVEAGVSANQAVAKVEARVNGGAWVALPKTDWGTWAKSVRAPDGSTVVFRATSATGATATSSTVKWA